MEMVGAVNNLKILTTLVEKGGGAQTERRIGSAAGEKTKRGGPERGVKPFPIT